MKTKIISKYLLGGVLAMLLAVSAVFPAFAAGMVSSLRISFTSSYEVGEILEPQVTVSTSGVSIESLSWSRDVEKWKPGTRVTATLILTADDGRSFSSTYGEKSCRISGATLGSAKNEDGKLRVTASYYPVVQLDSPDDAGWSNLEKTKASWKKVEYATGYQLRLYRDGDFVRTIDATGTSKDLSEYMTKEALYTYEIRAVAKDSKDSKYMKSSEYVPSTDQLMDDLGDTEGRWRNYSAGKKYQMEDGSYVTNNWHRIVGKWYYFNGEGYAQTGWQFVGDKWYYMNADGEMLTGWQKVNEVWYYLNGDGSMVTGWCQTAPNQWYYLNPDGSMAANTIIDGKRLNESGLCVE